MKKRLLKVIMAIGIPIMAVLIPIWAIVYIVNGRFLLDEYLNKAFID